MARRLANNQAGEVFFNTFEALLRLGNIFRAAMLPSAFLRKALPTGAGAAVTNAVSTLVVGIGEARVSSAAERTHGVLDRLV